MANAKLEGLTENSAKPYFTIFKKQLFIFIFQNYS